MTWEFSSGIIAVLMFSPNPFLGRGLKLRHLLGNLRKTWRTSIVAIEARVNPVAMMGVFLLPY